MKKMIALIMTLAMLMGLSMTVFAANGVTSSDSADVKATYNGTETTVVYSVDISWEGLQFTYNGAFEGTWNPTQHKYENATEAGWAEGRGVIKMLNHSNTAVTVKPFYSAKEEYKSAYMVFDNDSIVVATADNGVEGAAGTAVEEQIIVTPAGTLPEGTNGEVIGTITIEIK